ncbi:hypothetical protein B4135_0562 [Caldibacillus debilis]|uniref:Uncharacterized protein n=1 Tax=Caldibacillus debilis TaxID=301148 RepID=A0A150M9M0_9BACI|nr:hypothetical protein B4135_0562 [Caldibacillus debilis]
MEAMKGDRYERTTTGGINPGQFLLLSFFGRYERTTGNRKNCGNAGSCTRADRACQPLAKIPLWA